MNRMADGQSKAGTNMRLPVIDVRARPLYDQQPTLPSPTYNCRIFNQQGTQVGEGSFGVSPINDRVYFYDIEIAPKWRRHGYGTSFLAYLHDLYCLPITPVHITLPGWKFWAMLRQRAQENGWVITDELRSDLWDEPQKRWPHLLSHAERMKEVISHRIWELREPYDVATSRGLDDWKQDFPAPPLDDVSR
jgi:hypothetical protein